MSFHIHWTHMGHMRLRLSISYLFVSLWAFDKMLKDFFRKSTSQDTHSSTDSNSIRRTTDKASSFCSTVLSAILPWDFCKLGLSIELLYTPKSHTLGILLFQICLVAYKGKLDTSLTEKSLSQRYLSLKSSIELQFWYDSVFWVTIVLNSNFMHLQGLLYLAG